MKYVISSILEQIQSQTPNPAKQLRVRLSGFDQFGVKISGVRQGGDARQRHHGSQ